MSAQGHTAKWKSNSFTLLTQPLTTILYYYQALRLFDTLLENLRHLLFYLRPHGNNSRSVDTLIENSKSDA